MNEKSESGLQKRFVAQPDGVIDIYEARRNGVQEGIAEFVESDSACIGATMFGSLSKGTSGYLGDVDVCVFYNTAELAKKMNVKESDLYRNPNKEELELFKEKNELPLLSKVAVHYIERGASNIRKHISKLKMPKSPEVICVAMSEEIIDDALRVMRGRPGVQPPHIAESRLSRLFHQSVTQGVFPYRSMVLAKLHQQGKVGDRIWSRIIELTAKNERFDKSSKYEHPEDMPKPIDVRYPWTLEQAIKKYAPELIKDNVV